MLRWLALYSPAMVFTPENFRALYILVLVALQSPSFCLTTTPRGLALNFVHLRHRTEVVSIVDTAPRVTWRVFRCHKELTRLSIETECSKPNPFDQTGEH